MLKTNIEKHLLIIHLFLFNLYTIKQKTHYESN
jgi:hypothetical protein